MRKNMKKNIFKLVSMSLIIGTMPLMAFALKTDQCAGAGSTIGSLICRFQQLLNSIVPVLIALGVVYFVWGVVRYVIADGEEAKKKGKDGMIYGIIGFAVILGMWGLVNIVVNTLGFSPSDLNAPQLVAVQAGATNGSCTLDNNVQGILGYATCLINNSVIPFIFALAIVMFIWGAVKYFIINSDEEAKREQGKQFMIWGIIALTVMVSVWGLVNIVAGTFGIKNTSILPQVHPPGQQLTP